MRCEKLGCLSFMIKWKWWESHKWHQALKLINEETIRVFLGCWDRKQISTLVI